MDKTAALASDILQGIGGEKNIQRLENCMTRVRVEVHNDDQLDVPRLKQLCQQLEKSLHQESDIDALEPELLELSDEMANVAREARKLLALG